MKKRTLTFSLLITLTSGFCFAMKSDKANVKRDFTLSINDARSEQSDLLESFQEELQVQYDTTPEEAEVIEFLNSEIRWKSPQQNAKKQ